MSVRQNHVSIDRLTALALVGRAPEGDDTADNSHDRDALAHVGDCDQCAATFARLVADADSLRAVAFAAADDVFDDAMLDAQRTRILDRLAHLGRAARVISFPRRTREAAMPVSTGSRRWVSVAAAAGLIIGLVTGQMLHFVQGAPSGAREEAITSMQAPPRQGGPAIIPASASMPSLSDDELLDEVESAVLLPRAHSLRALDAFTPRASDLLSMGR
jgi:hypothetical protein